MSAEPVQILKGKGLQVKFLRLAGRVKIIFSGFARQVAESSAEILRVYPPPRAKSRHVRTGRLGRSWTLAEAAPTGWKLKNAAAHVSGRYYAIYVHGDASGQRQAWMHTGRWKVGRRTVELEALR